MVITKSDIFCAHVAGNAFLFTVILLFTIIKLPPPEIQTLPQRIPLNNEKRHFISDDACILVALSTQKHQFTLVFDAV